MIKIPEVSTPKTLKTYTTTKGETYVLKGADKSFQDSYAINNLKLYKKTNLDGLDSFQLVSKKEEKSLVKGDGTNHFISIKKEHYNSLGKMIEQSEISQNIFGGKNIECNGDVFSMKGSISTNLKENMVIASIDNMAGKLTPISKRILKIINK